MLKKSSNETISEEDWIEMVHFMILPNIRLNGVNQLDTADNTVKRLNFFFNKTKCNIISVDGCSTLLEGFCVTVRTNFTDLRYLQNDNTEYYP